MAPRHALHAQRQRHREDGRQAFGNGRRRQRHDHHEHLGRRMAPPQDADQEGQRRGGEDRDRQHAAEMVDLAQQRRGLVAHAGEHVVDAAQFGGVAGGDDVTAGLAVHDHRAGIGHARAIAQRRIGLDRCESFLRRQRLAGERGLFDAQVLHREQPQVGRHAVAGGEHDDIARHQFGGVDLAPAAIADHVGMRRQHGANRVQRRFRPAFLDEADDRIDDHCGDQHAGVHPVAEQGGDRRRAQHHVQQHVVELQQQAQQRAAPARWCQPVGAMAQQALPRLVRSQTVVAGLQRVLHLFAGEGMPARVRGRRHAGGGEGGVHGSGAPDRDSVRSIYWNNYIIRTNARPRPPCSAGRNRAREGSVQREAPRGRATQRGRGTHRGWRGREARSFCRLDAMKGADQGER